MNKASVSKKTLSVFLSFLMILSCCVTATPWLADTFGLKADAATTAHVNTLKAAIEKAIALDGTAGLSSWTSTGANGTSRTITDTSDHGVVYPIVVALFDVIKDDTNTGNSTSNNRPAAVKSSVNNDIDSATTNTTARTKVKELAAFIIDYSSFTYYYSTQASQDSDASAYGAHYWHDDYTTSGDASASALSAIDDYTVTVSRTTSKATKYYSKLSGTDTDVLPENVTVSCKITFDIGKDYHHWTNKGGVLNLFTRDNANSWYRYDSVTIGSQTTASSQKDRIIGFFNRFGSSQATYASDISTAPATVNGTSITTNAQVKAALDDRNNNFDYLYKIDTSISDVVTQNNVVYNYLNTTPSNYSGSWTDAWRNFIDNSWKTYIHDTFMVNCEAALLAKNNKEDIAELNGYYNVGTTVTVDNLEDQIANYDAAIQLYNDLRSNLDKAVNAENGTIKDSAVEHLKRLGSIESSQAASQLKEWTVYAQYLADLKENIERYNARVLKQQIVTLLEELEPTYLGTPTAEDSHIFRNENAEGETLPVLTDERLQSLSVEIKTAYNELATYNQSIVNYVFEQEGLAFVSGKENDDAYKFPFTDVGFKISELNQEATIRHFDPEVTDLMAYYQYQNNRDLTLYSVTSDALRSEVDVARNKLTRAQEIFNILKNGNDTYTAVGEAIATTMFLDINSDPAADLRTELQNLINKFYDRLFGMMKEEAEKVYGYFVEQNYQVNINNFKLIQNGINSLKANDEDFYKYLMGEDPYNERENADYTKNLMNAVQGSPYFRGLNSGNYAQSVSGLYQWLKAELKAACDLYQQQRFDNFRQTQLEDESSTGSTTAFDSYAVRESTADDFARLDEDPDYYATDARVQALIDDLDDFLTSHDLPKLIDLKKTVIVDGEEVQVPYTKLDGTEVENLSELIDALLREKLFSDDMMNTIVDMLYGSISRLLGYQLGNLLFDTSGSGGQKWDPLDLYTLGTMIGQNGTNVVPLNLSGRWTIISYSVESVSIDGGNIDLYLNGKKNTTTLKNLLSSLGLNIFPEKLADSMGAYPSIQQKLRNAANWDPDYTVSAATTQSRNDYNKYMGRISGDWTAVNLSNGEVYTDAPNGGYNPYLYKYDEAKEKYVLDFDWGIDGDYDRFVNALGVILESIKPLLQVILCGKDDYNQAIGNDAIALDAHDATITINNARAAGIISMQYTKAGFDLNGTAGGTLSVSVKDSEDHIIKGFNDLFGPIFEALGIPDYQYKTGLAGSTLVSNLSKAASGAEMAHAVIDPLNELIRQVTNHPLDKILSILPNVAFALSFDLLQPLIDMINIDIKFTLGIGSLEITSVDVKDSSWPDWLVQILLDALKGTLSNVLKDNLHPDIPITLSLGDMLQLSELLGVDITDLNAILVKFLGNSENPNIANLVNNIPVMNTPVLGTLGVLLGQRNSGTNYLSSIRLLSRYGVPAGYRYSIQADKADVLWFILTYLGEALASKDFRDVILSFLGIDVAEPEEGDMLGDILTTLLANVSSDPEALPLALVEIFQPYTDAAHQKSGYGIFGYKWWNEATDAVSSDDEKEDMLGKKASDYLYLAYKNDWSYDKAQALYENIDKIITNLLKDEIQKKKDEHGNPLYNTFGQMLMSAINLAFSSQALETVIRGLARMGNLSVMDNTQLKYIISRFPDNTGMSLKLWSEAFGYYFYNEETDAENDSIVRPDAPATVAGPDGYTIINISNDIFGRNMFNRLAFKANTERTEEDVENNVANQFLWMFNMEADPTKPANWVPVGEDTDHFTARRVFQSALEYVLKGFLPAIDIFLSGKAGDLFNQSKWDPSDSSTLVTIPGNNGYDNALIPLFEAIGINEDSDYLLAEIPEGADVPSTFRLLTQDQFDALPSESTVNDQGEVVLGKVSYLFEMAFGFLEALSATDRAAIDGSAEIDEDDVGAYNHLIQHVLTIVVPQLLYFLQSNGLSTSVLNLLKPLLVLIDDLIPVLGLNKVGSNMTNLLDVILVPLLNDLLGFEAGSPEEITSLNIELKDLSFHKLADVIENVTHLNMRPLVYGMDAICAIDRAPANSSSSVSKVGGQGYKRYTFSEPAEGQENGGHSNKNDPANTITVLLSLLLDIVLADSQIEGKTNADVVIDLVKNFVGDENTIINMLPSIIDAIRDLGGAAGWTVSPNWFYFDEDAYDPSSFTFGDTVDMPVRTIYYLRYAENFHDAAGELTTDNLWSRELASYLDSSLASLVDYVITLIDAGEDNGNAQSLGEYLNNLLESGGLITNATVNGIAKTLRENVAPALKDFSDLLKVFLGFDVSYWSEENYPEIEEGSETALTLSQFGQQLVTLLAPLDNVNEGENGILSWLLAGESMAFFHSYKTTGGYTYYVASDKPSDYGDLQDLITIPGGEGYWRAIIPLFEALGLELPKSGDAYKYQREENTGRIYYMNGDNKVYATGIEILSDVITALLTQVEGWFAVDETTGATKLIDEVLNRIANVFYFLNANGLVSIVINLLAPLAPLANAIAPLVFQDLAVPEDADEQTKFVAIVDSIIDSFLTTDATDTNGDPIYEIDEETGLPKEDEDGNPIVKQIPVIDTIMNLDLEHIFEILHVMLGLDINGAVTANFKHYDAESNTLLEAENYNYLTKFFLGQLVTKQSANGEKYWYMNFTDEETRYDLITILLYTVMDVFYDAHEAGTDNNKFFINLLGKTDEEDEEGNAIIDTALGQSKLDALYNILNAHVEGYEGYDWFYFDREAREAYYEKQAYSAALEARITEILNAINGSGYTVNKADTTMWYLLNTYLNYQDDNFWNEEKALAVQEGFDDLMDTVLKAVANKDREEGEPEISSADFLNGFLNDYIRTNQLVVTVGAVLGNLMSGMDDTLVTLLKKAIPGFDPSAWNAYAGTAVEDADHPAGSTETAEDGTVTTYVAKVEYASDAEFINAFVGLVQPFGYLLDWLLFGEHKSIELFYVNDDDEDVEGTLADRAAINIGGADGFKNGLVPLLEAIGLQFSASEIETISNGENPGVEAVRLTLNSLMTWIRGITGSENPVSALVEYVPNLIYFINANGLTVTVLNTLRSLTNILEQAAVLLKKDDDSLTNLNTLLGLDKKGIDLYDLSLEGICNIVKGLTAGDDYEGLDILKGVGVPVTRTVQKTDEEGHPVFDDNDQPVMEEVTVYESYLTQWAIGKVVSYASGSGNIYYKMQFANTADTDAGKRERIDILTILLCSVFDVFRYDGNEGALRALLGNLDLGDMDLYEVIKSILNVTMAEIEYAPYDWFYFDDEITDDAAFDTKDAADGNADHQVPVEYDDSTFGYLAYIGKFKGATNNIWNETTAKNVKDGVYDILDSVISNIEIGGTKYESVDSLISTLWGDLNLYSWENIYKIGSLVGGLLKDVDATVFTVLNVLLGIDLSSFSQYVNVEITNDQSLEGVRFNKVKDEETGEESNVVDENGEYTYVYKESLTMSRDAFVNEIVSLIEPAGFLLDWLLAGKSIKVLYQKVTDEETGAPLPQIDLTGAYGFDVAIIPLMEALGCDLSGYDALVASRDDETGIPTYTASAEGEPTIGVKLLKLAANSLLGRIDAIAQGGSPLEDIVAMLPELIYFINANGLSVSVMNLLVPAVGLVDAVGALLPASDDSTEPTGDDEDLSSYERVVKSLNDIINGLDAVKNIEGLTVDLGDLTMVGILEMVGGALGLEINDAICGDWVEIDEGVEVHKEYKNILATLALGIVEQFTSANGDTAYRMLADTTNWTAELIEEHDGRTIGGIDMFAIILSIALDVIRYEGNEAFLRDKLNGMKEGLYDLILGILNLNVDFSYNNYDWFYFDDASGDEIIDKASFDSHATDHKVTVSYQGTELDYFAYKYGYLEYFRYWNGAETSANIWTKDFADGLAAKFYDLADLIIEAVTGQEENEEDRYTSMSKFIADKWNGLNLYTEENIWKIGALIGNVTSGIQDVLADALKLLLDVDLTVYNKYVETIADPDNEEQTIPNPDYVAPSDTPLTITEFVDELVGLVEPVGILLDWLLAGRSIDVLYQYNGHAQISLKGADGYGEALVPILEALGCTPNKNYFGSGEGQVAYTGVNILKYVAELLLTRIDEIANSKDSADKPNCLNVIVSMIPELIYFINANGLYVSVTNLLSPVTALIAELGPTIEGLGLELPEGLALGEIEEADDLVNMVLDMLKENGTLPFDISFDSGKLNIVGILDLVKQITAVAADGETPAIDGLDINSSVVYTTTVTNEETGETTEVTVPNIFATLALGIVEQYQSLANDKIYYKMYASDAEDYTLHNVDLLAIIIGAALDTFKNEANEGILRKWLGDYYGIVKGILDITVESFDPYQYDWFYFDPAITDDTTDENNDLVPGNWQTYFPNDGSKVPVKYNDTTSTYFAYKFGYLEYFKSWTGSNADGNLWTAELANYLNTHFTELIDTVVSAIEIDGTKYESAKQLISTLWGNLNLYSKKNLYAIGKAVGNVLGGIEGVVKDVLGLVLGIDIGDFSEYLEKEPTDDSEKVGTTYTDDDGNVITYIANETLGRTAFINEIANIIKPASFLLDWLLAGKDIEFMYLKDGNAAISLPGANGFDTALVPIIEAFGCDLSDADEYFSREAGGRTGLNMIKLVADKLLGKIDTIAASDDPVNGILALIPNLLYFINANGLGVSVKNLLEPAALLVASLKETLSALPFELPEGINEIEHVDDLVTLVLDALNVDFEFSLDKLDLTGIFDLVEALTAKAATDTEPAKKGLNINDAVTYIYTDPETGLDTFADGNIFETLALGIVERYTSNANGKMYFKMYLGEAEDGTLNTIDLIAIILSAALDVFKYEDNRDFLEPLLNGLKDGLYELVLKILNVSVDLHEVDFDWFYFNRNVTADDFTDANEHKIVVDYNDQTREYFIETYTYLHYLKEDTGNLWNARTASYIEEHFYDLADMIITAVTQGAEDPDKRFTSIGAFLQDAWSGVNLYTEKNIWSIGSMIGGLLGGLDATLADALGILLGVDLTMYNKYIEGNDAYVAPSDTSLTYEQFVDELVSLIEPAGILLDWLLAGKSISFLYDKEGQPAIHLEGANGFDSAIVPILEALGCDMSGYTDMVEYTVVDGVRTKVYREGIGGVKLVEFAAKAILGRLETIIASENPVQTVVAMLPELIYFINANGLGTCVTNLVSPAVSLVEIASSFMGSGDEATGDDDDDDLTADERVFKALNTVINGIEAVQNLGITIDLQKLNITGIFDIVGGILGLEINAAVTNSKGWNVYKTLALGIVSQYESVNTRTYYRMDLASKTYDDNGNLTVAPLAPIDMLAILLGSVVDIFKYEDNKPFLEEKLGEYYDLIDTILKLSVDVSYADYDWFYFDDDFGDAIKPGAAENGGTWETFFPEVGSKVKVSYRNDRTLHNYFEYKYGYLEYLDPANAENGNFWNKKTADYIEGNFYNLVDTIVKNIEIDGVKYDTAAALLQHLWSGVNLYTEKNVWAVGSLIGTAIQGLDATIQEVLGVVLGVDATVWNKYIEGKEGYVAPSETPLTRDQFLNELIEILTPADFLLSWLLVGEEHPFQLLFDKEGEPAIAIKGGNGFKEALVPILEALGCTITAEEVAAADTGMKALRLTADKLLGRVDAIAASDDAVREIVGMIPELVYFINSNGLGTTVKNLLAPVAGLIEKVLPILPADLLGSTEINDIDDLIGFVLAKIKESNEEFNLERLSLDNLGMVGIFDIVGQLLGLHINEAVAWDDPDTADVENINIFATLALGWVERYLSANGHDDFFKSYVTGADDDTLGNVDLLAIIISAALDVFKYEDNAEFLRTNLDKIKEGLYDTIMEVLNLSMDLSYADYDWFYFDDTMGDAITNENWQTAFPADGAAYRVPYEVGTMGQLEYRFGYLEYRKYFNDETNNLWNKTTAAYFTENFYDLVDTIITIATKGKDKEFTSFSAFLSDAWSGLNLYSEEKVWAVGKLVGNALQGLDETIKEILGIVLGVDVTYWNKYIEGAEGYVAPSTAALTRTQFVDELVAVFQPADLLLNWLLVGEEKPLTFFYDKNGEPAVSIKGGNGFKMAVVPILEAFGCDLTAAEVNAANTGIKAVQLTVEKLLAKIDGIAASSDALREIVALVPELVYFINANGLGTTVKRLVAPVAGLLEKMGSLISSDLNTVDDLIAFVLDQIPDSPITSLSLDHLDITGIFDIIKQILGIDINKAVTYVHGDTYENIYETLALGEVVRFTSANGETSFRMHAVDDETTLATIDMIAILAATVANVFTLDDADHVAALKELLKDENIYNTVNKVLTLEKDNKYAEFQWLFTYKDSNAVPQIDPTYQNQYVSPIDKISSITGTAGYDRYWTKEMAQYVADNLVKVVNNVLLLIGISIPGIDGPIESIDDLINGLLPGGSIYTNELMGKIVSAIVGTGETKEDGSIDKGLIGKLDEIDPDGLIRELLNVSLKIDLSTLDAYRGRTNFGFTDGDRAGFTNAIAQFLSPVYPLLKWLLTDEDISLFYNVDKSDLIKLPGGKGYEQAIIPIMEAILPTNARVKTLAQYKSDVAANQNAMLTDILDPLFDFVEDVLADPLNTVLARIPAIVYFINSKGIDTAVKNLIHPAYAILNALNALVDIDLDETIKGLIGFSLEELDFEALVEVVLKLLPEGLSSMKPLIVDAVKEFTIGIVVKKNSKAVYVSANDVPYYHFFTMELASGSASGTGSVIGSQNASLADLITILLRAVLKWITLPENQPTVVEFLSNNIENEVVREYVLNAYGADPETYQTIDTGLIGFLYQPYGISQMMGMLYYVYFAVNLASSEAVNAVGTYGNYWPYVVKGLTAAMNNGVVDLSFLTGFITYMNGLVERVNGQNNNGGDNGGNGTTTPTNPTTEDTDGGHGTIGDVVDDINSGNVDPSSSTSLNFFQRIIKWFQDLFAKIARMFGR